MKKLCIVFVLVLSLLATPGFAITWHTANQSTFAWTPVNFQVDANERLRYVVVVANAITDPGKTNPVEVGTIDTPQYQLTLATKGSYLLGVKSVVEVYGDTTGWVQVSESPLSWSDDPVVCFEGQTFGVRFYPAPPRPIGLKPIQ